MIPKRIKVFGGLVALTLASGCTSNNLQARDPTLYTVTMAYQGNEITTQHKGEDQRIIYQQPDKIKENNHAAILVDLASYSKLYCLR